MFLCIFTMYSQTSDDRFMVVRGQLEDLFRGLNKSKVITELLLDIGVDLVDLFDYDGSELTERNIVTFPVYKNILKSILSCHILRSTAVLNTKSVDSMLANFQAESDGVGLTFTAFRYNYIVENALEDNLICYDESKNKVSDKVIDGKWQNPYSEAVVFAFIPSVSEVTSLNVTYTLLDRFNAYNILINRLEFDPGDGGGYRLIVPGAPFNVAYEGYGTKVLKLRLMAQGRVYQSHSIINLKETENIVISPDLQDGTIIPEQNTVEYNSNGNNYSAKYTCYHIPGNSSLTRPFIVVEGFDPWMLKSVFDDVPDEDFHLGFTNHAEFYDKHWDSCSLQNSYDLIYIDWGNSLADINVNAELLIKILKEVNASKAMSGSSETNVVMGQSMGGLIARCALNKMEKEAIPHETSTYISHDAPHLGANVPLGALYFIQQFMSFAHGHENLIEIVDLFNSNMLSNAEEKLYEVLHAESVKQMLVNYVNEYSALDNSTHNDWQTTISMAGFPKTTENIAIVNGRPFDVSTILSDDSHFLYVDGYVKSGLWTNLIKGFTGNVTELIIWLSGDPYAAALWGFSPTRINVRAEINPLSSTIVEQPVSRLDVTYTKKFLWFIHKEYEIFSSVITCPSVGVYYDELPGSLYSFSNFGGPQDVVNKTIDDSSNWGSYHFDIRMGNKMMFIPTASALAIQSEEGLGASYYMRDYYINPPIPEVETPFCSYVLAREAQEHIHLTDTIIDWIGKQVCANIEGPDTLSTVANYSASGFDTPLKWSCSDMSKAIIDNNGKLTAISNGAVTITAESYFNGRLIRKKKDVMIGHPDLAISYSFSPGSGHMFYVSAPNSEDVETLQNLVDAGYLNYEWSVLCDESDMVTTVTKTPSITHLPKEDEVITVCLRLVDNDGNKGETYSRTINLKNPFTTNYKYVKVNAIGTVTFIKENGYEIGAPSEDFTIDFRNIIYSQSDNAYNLVLKYIQGNTCYLYYPNGLGFTYLQGNKISNQLKWRFSFLDTELFVNSLDDIVNRAGSTSISQGEMIDFGIYICNSNKKVMQRVPFAIIYN